MGLRDVQTESEGVPSDCTLRLIFVNEDGKSEVEFEAHLVAGHTMESVAQSLEGLAEHIRFEATTRDIGSTINAVLRNNDDVKNAAVQEVMNVYPDADIDTVSFMVGERMRS